jgi:hypothetical protein
MVLTSTLSMLAVMAQQPMDGPAVLAKMVETLRRHQSVTGVLIWDSGGHQERVEFAFAKPHFYKEVRQHLEFYQSGALRQSYMTDIKQYERTERLGRDGRVRVSAPLLLGLEPLLNDGPIPYTAAPEVRMVEFRGKKAYEITLLMRFETKKPLIVDAESFLPLGSEDKMGTGSVQDSLIYSELKFDVPLKPEDFAWTPPKDATEYVNTENYEAGFIKVGQPVPDLVLPKPDGGTLNLKELLKGKKGLVLNFWFYG